ncbi:hypothetical protein [Kitasatospora sp. NPDC094015]|uniref:hypothetical protein n=1 Tax=Kitasatospora sp. NPDC094015 TaxID=3155205 RepID=UPI0033215DF5
MMKTVIRGAVAGAAGTTALNATAYADMALRGRPTSSVPEQIVDTAAHKVGLEVPGEGARREARLTGLGALSGIAVGAGVGVAVAVLRAGGIRLPVWVGGTVTAALAMAASDLPIAGLGVSDPRTWSAVDWVSDAVPHLVYGLVTYGVVAGAPARR